MNPSISRRSFLKRSVAGGLVTAGTSALFGLPASAIEPVKRSGAPRMRLSLAAYSFRDTFKHKDPAKRITMFDFVDYCADHDCDAAEVTSYYFPDPVDNNFLLRLKRHAFLRGVEFSGTAVGNNFVQPPGDEREKQITSVKKWVDHAAVLGAPHIRVFAGPLGKHDPADAKQWCISALGECCDYAAQKGVFLGLENHGGIVAEADDLLEIVRAIDNPWFGINLDSGNFHTDDPYGDLAKCAPYAVNAQVKVELRGRNDKEKKPADFARLIKILRDANYQGYVALEYEAADDPWEAVPGHLRRLKALLS